LKRNKYFQVEKNISDHSGVEFPWEDSADKICHPIGGEGRYFKRKYVNFDRFNAKISDIIYP
jgi:hypothetical protein